jgi:hypothetical protein
MKVKRRMVKNRGFYLKIAINPEITVNYCNKNTLKVDITKATE